MAQLQDLARRRGVQKDRISTWTPDGMPVDIYPLRRPGGAPVVVVATPYSVRTLTGDVCLPELVAIIEGLPCSSYEEE
jgi:hypothetical protein